MLNYQMDAPTPTLPLIIINLLLVYSLAVPPVAIAAGPCEAGLHTGTTRFAIATSFYPTTHTGCTQGVPSGAATDCHANTMSFVKTNNAFRVTWPSTGARLGDNTGGCAFMCTSGDCVVRNDGLPVELLSFGVE